MRSAAIAALVCLTGLSACGGGGGGNNAGSPVTPPVAVPLAQAPAITAQPLSQSVQNGQPATFTIAAGGAEPLSYQWSRNGVAIAGATAASYTLAAVQLGDNGAVFGVTARNAAGNAESAKASLTVTGTGLVSFAGAMRDNKTDPGVLDKAPTMAGLAIDSAGNLFVAGVQITKISSNGAMSRIPMPGSCNTRAASQDKVGNIYVSCMAAIYKISASGAVSLVAGDIFSRGTTDGQGATARFNDLSGIAVDANGIIYVADHVSEDGRLRRIDTAGNVTTISLVASKEDTGGRAPVTTFQPRGLAIDTDNNVVFINGNQIRRVTPTGTVSTVAGATDSGWAEGDAINARFFYPGAIATDAAGNIYVSDTGNNVIRKIGTDGKVRTLVGRQIASADGAGMQVPLGAPQGIVVDAAGSVFVNDSDNLLVRKITPAGLVSTVAKMPARPRSIGSLDGLAQEARFSAPKGISVDAAGNVFVADSSNHTIRKIAPDGAVSTLAGTDQMSAAKNGSGAQAYFRVPTDLGIDDKGTLYVFDQVNEDVSVGVTLVRKVSPAGVVTTLTIPEDPLNVSRAGLTIPSIHRAMTADAAGNVYIASSVDYRGPFCTNCDSLLRFALRRIAPDGKATTLADLSNGAMAGIPLLSDQIAGMAVDSAGTIYISDVQTHVIWKLTAKAMTNFAGKAYQRGTSDGKEGARFSSPGRMALDKAGNLFVVDNGSSTIRKITPAGVVSTVAGSPGKNEIVLGDLPGGLVQIGGIAVDAKGVLYVTVADGVVKIMLPPVQ